MTFKMKSCNAPVFKMMGNSPLKDDSEELKLAQAQAKLEADRKELEAINNEDKKEHEAKKELPETKVTSFEKDSKSMDYKPITQMTDEEYEAYLARKKKPGPVA